MLGRALNEFIKVCNDDVATDDAADQLKDAIMQDWQRRAENHDWDSEYSSAKVIVYEHNSPVDGSVRYSGIVKYDTPITGAKPDRDKIEIIVEQGHLVCGAYSPYETRE